MTIRIISSPEHAEDVQNVMQYLQDLNSDDHPQMTATAESLERFLNVASLATGASGQLDTALMGEIGKAYKEQYSEASQKGDQQQMDRFYGAMFATKKIMDMVQDPEF